MKRRIIIGFILSSYTLAACEPDKSAVSLNVTTQADVEFDQLAGRWVDDQPILGVSIAPPTYETLLPFDVVEEMEHEMSSAPAAPVEPTPVEEPEMIQPPDDVDIIAIDLPPLQDQQETEIVVETPPEEEIEEHLPIDLLN